MKTHLRILSLLIVSGALATANTASAGLTLVSTIDGGYDLYTGDSPSLTISNTTGFDFTNVQMTLLGYQGLNNGITATFAIGTIGAHTNKILDWGVGPQPFVSGSLYTFDYDDTYPNTGYTNPGCILGPTYCALVGNFKTTITATWQNGGAGTAIFSQFTPSNNASGGYVGWEGLDPNGLSETSYDDHSGTPHGILANIYVGTPGVPEPASWALMLLGFGGLGVALRGRSKASSPART